MRRVAITGMGIVAPCGQSPTAFFDALVAGRSGVGRLPAEFAPRLATRIAASVDFDAAAHFAPPRRRMLDRVSQFALVAAAQAMAASNPALRGEEQARAGVCLGTGMGGAGTVDAGYHALLQAHSERMAPFSVLLAMNNAPAAWLASEYGLRGPSLTYSTACSSSAVAIGEAWRRIRSGDADLMLARGAEAPLTLGTMKAWEALRTLAAEDPADPSRSCKPFALDRSGLVLGEGAAVLVLEDWQRAQRRGAEVLAELIGYGLGTDIDHLTQPSVDGQAACMRRALASALLQPEEIDHVNAHGTGTQANDATETAAIRAVFAAHADRLPVSATKSMHGHLLGAAAAVELVACVAALQRGIVPPTLHRDLPDPACDLDYVPDQPRRPERLQTAMSNSFAFGGCNAVLIVRRAA